MLLGLDFDNTIVRYDSLFHKVALERGLIPSELPASKLSVRDYLRRAGKEDVWIEMQGYVYGARMAEAEMYPGVQEFLHWARRNQLPVAIISHKTRYPFAGPKYDLHQAARGWVQQWLRDEQGPYLAPSFVHFELTKEAKLARIVELGCTIYVDDLPEILEAPAFPKNASALLFDPEGDHAVSNLPRLNSWADLRHTIEREWLLKS